MRPRASDVHIHGPLDSDADRLTIRANDVSVSLKATFVDITGRVTRVTP